jgi:hypothetical protein
MPSEILIKFALTEPSFAHRIRNFGEDLDREVVKDRYATTSLDEIDKATSEILVQLQSAKAGGRTVAMIKKLLKQHLLVESARIFVDGRRVDERMIGDV